jgi:short subunit fatty acids transporter
MVLIPIDQPNRLASSTRIIAATAIPLFSETTMKYSFSFLGAICCAFPLMEVAIDRPYNQVGEKDKKLAVLDMSFRNVFLDRRSCNIKSR